MGTGASDVRHGGTATAKQGTGTGALGHAAVSTAGTLVSAAAKPAAKRRNRRKKKNGVVSENMVVDAGHKDSGVLVAACAPAAGAPACVLERKTSRERSPHRVASPMPPSFSLASIS